VKQGLSVACDKPELNLGFEVVLSDLLVSSRIFTSFPLLKFSVKVVCHKERGKGCGKVFEERRNRRGMIDGYSLVMTVVGHLIQDRCGRAHPID
jgi:hypothetical protein